MFGREAVDEGFGGGGEGRTRGLVDAQGAQGVEDHGDVDGFLEQRAGGGREQTGGCRAHGCQRHDHAAEGALHSGAAGAWGDGDGVAEAVDAGRWSGRCRALLRRPWNRGRPWRRRRREGGGVVDAVADHDGDGVSTLVAYGGDLAGRAEFGEHAVEAEQRGDLVGGCGPVAGEHEEPLDAGRTQMAKGAWGVVAQRVAQQDRTGELSVDGEPGHGRAVAERPVVDRPGPWARTSSGPRRPMETRWPFTLPVAPRPGTSVTSVGRESERSRCRAVSTMARARTCGEYWSTEAAGRRTSVRVMSGAP